MKTVLITALFTLTAFFCVVSCSKQNKTVPTQVVFYLSQYCAVIPLVVTCSDTSKTIYSFFIAPPGCSDTGTAKFTLPAGTYKMTAKGGNLTWAATVTVNANQCNVYYLDCSGNTGTGTGTGTTTTYYYANWTCNGQAQCITTMGAASGSTGPFCTLTDCQAWKNKFIPGSCNCETTPNSSPILGGAPPNGRKCFQIGDF